jgi:hypothetical protein
MNEGLTTAMAEATRLTRAGRLHEATALIQRRLRGGFVPDSSPDTLDATADAPIDAEFKVLEPVAPMVVQRPDRSARTVKEIGSPEENTSSASTTRQEPTLLDPLRHSLTNPLGVSVLKPDQTNRDVWAGGRFIAAAFTHEARTRAYKLYIPSSYRGQSLPHRRLRTNLPGRCHSSSRARPTGGQRSARWGRP